MEVATIKYIAGFFDGEGCISIGRPNTSLKSSGAGRYWCYHLSLQCAQLNPFPLALLLKHFGGRVKTTGQAAGVPIYRWHTSGKSARAFLEQIGPHLIVKRQQAKLGLLYLDTLVSQTAKWMVMVMPIREKMRLLMSELNHANRRIIDEKFLGKARVAP
jgi:hypothetical protein